MIRECDECSGIHKVNVNDRSLERSAGTNRTQLRIICRKFDERHDTALATSKHGLRHSEGGNRNPSRHQHSNSTLTLGSGAHSGSTLKLDTETRIGCALWKPSPATARAATLIYGASETATTARSGASNAQIQLPQAQHNNLGATCPPQCRVAVEEIVASTGSAVV